MSERGDGGRESGSSAPAGPAPAVAPPAARGIPPGEPATVSLRPAGPGDEEFLFALYRDTRAGELAAWGWGEAQQIAFLEMQFAARRSHYDLHYPNASNQIIVRGEHSMGRLLVARREGEIHLVDIALLGEHRGAGIGAALIGALLAEGDASGLPVRLSVLGGNPAQRLYERLGFVPTGDNGMHLLMERWPRR